ncbi:MAG: cryptochrome/photolyase family protein, partial [Ferruginibacter sp.]
RRVDFIHQTLQQLQLQLQPLNSALQVFYSTPFDVFTTLAQKYTIDTVYTNHDYEPYAQERDAAIETLLKTYSIQFKHYKDQVIFEQLEVAKDDGKPYTVFTPYSKKWKAGLTEKDIRSFPTEKYFSNFYPIQSGSMPSLNEMGFQATGAHFPPNELQQALVEKYAQQRDVPSIEGTSKLGVHLRFGTVSIRALVQKCKPLSETFLNELIWRDFYHMILWNFPQVGRGMAFKPAYDHIEWQHDEEAFARWCKGNTGYPIVDAGMRELNATGFMHNRVRMIVASFLTKHLLIDWRLGEAYFAQQLLDFDLAANNGGWQWASGSGCDAAPYFRIFNPRLQTEKFDPQLKYIKKWVPEFQEFGYPPPIVVHEFARKRCLEVYAKALK